MLVQAQEKKVLDVAASSSSGSSDPAHSSLGRLAGSSITSKDAQKGYVGSPGSSLDLTKHPTAIILVQRLTATSLCRLQSDIYLWGFSRALGTIRTQQSVDSFTPASFSSQLSRAETTPKGILQRSVTV
jgi:hypothetical protein